MNAVFDFLKAALPWIAMGLLPAVYFAWSARRKQTGAGDYGSVGICLGMCFGTALGTAFGNNTGVGISVGMLLGLVIGRSIPRQEDDADEDETG